MGKCRYGVHSTGWTTGGLNSGRGKRFFSSPNRPDRLRGTPSFLFNGYGWFYPLGLNGRGVKPKLISGAITPRLYVFIEWTGTILPLLEEKRHSGICRYIWEDNIKMGLLEIDWKSSICQAERRDSFWALVKTKIGYTIHGTRVTFWLAKLFFRL
jgi:hypothetical protein